MDLTPETLVEDVIGCGKFQVWVVLLVNILTKVPTAATFMFMSFGNYNPGWRCLDNVTSFHSDGDANHRGHWNGTTSSDGELSSNQSSLEYTVGSCEVYQSCQHVEFNPDSSTIVTEWALLCDRAWISSFIISVQMAGALIGSLIAGQIGDSFGRKTVVYSCIAALAVFNAVSTYSTSWQMFAVLRFFLGAAASSLLAAYYVLTNEFILEKWRGPVTAIPAWNVGSITFSIIAMYVRDWKKLHIATIILSVLCFLPVVWVPESLRWLAVKQKKKRFIKVAKQMAELNKKSMPSVEMVEGIITNTAEEGGKKKYRIHHLFHRGYRTYTLLMAFLWMSFSVIYYAISFGVKNMYGDFYINLIILFALEMPFAIFPSFTPNLLGRVKGSAVFIVFAIGCIATVAGIQIWGSNQAKEIGSIILSLSKVTINSAWCIVILHTTEIYPTVVRGLSLGWGCLMARVGGILAPFLIPSTTENLHISFIAMAALSCVCCVAIFKLPETRGRPLFDNFEDEDQVTSLTEEDTKA